MWKCWQMWSVPDVQSNRRAWRLAGRTGHYQRLHWMVHCILFFQKFTITPCFVLLQVKQFCRPPACSSDCGEWLMLLVLWGWQCLHNWQKQLWVVARIARTAHDSARILIAGMLPQARQTFDTKRQTFDTKKQVCYCAVFQVVETVCTPVVTVGV